MNILCMNDINIILSKGYTKVNNKLDTKVVFSCFGLISLNLASKVCIKNKRSKVIDFQMIIVM